MFENAIQSGKRLRVDMGQYILQTSKKRKVAASCLHRKILVREVLHWQTMKLPTNCCKIMNKAAMPSLIITKLIIKITISSIVIGLKNSYSYFPLIHLPSCYRTVCYWTVCYRTVVIGQFNKPITFKVVV